MDPQALSAVPGFRQATPDWFSAGQPAPADWARLRAAGLRSVINLRPAAEQPGADEAGDVARAGLDYAHLPIDGGAALDREAATRFADLVARLPMPVLVHCASGNRVGALMALERAWVQGMAPDEALALGRRGGLVGLEPRVRDLLGLPAA